MNHKTDSPSSNLKTRYILGTRKTRKGTRHMSLEKNFLKFGRISKAGGLTIRQIDGLNVHQGQDVYLLEVWDVFRLMLFQKNWDFYRGLVSLHRWTSVKLWEINKWINYCIGTFEIQIPGSRGCLTKIEVKVNKIFSHVLVPLNHLCLIAAKLLLPICLSAWYIHEVSKKALFASKPHFIHASLTCHL